MEIYFPHEKVRSAQKELLKEIYKAIESSSSLLAQAPTGIGKTASSLAPAITYAIKSRENLKVLFVTPKHTQHRIAIDTARLLKERYNLGLVVTDLIGKRLLCSHPGAEIMMPAEFGEYCRELLAKDQCSFYSNTKTKKPGSQTESVLKQLKKTILHVEEQKHLSMRNKLCPYEIACLLAQESKLIIADYHHILNPSIRENFLRKTNTLLSDLIIIFDEAHNLPERTREIMSSETSTIIIENAVKEANFAKYRDIAEDIQKLKQELESLAKERLSIEENEKLITKQDLTKRLEKILDYEEFLGNLELIAEETHEHKRRSYASSLSLFLQSWLGPDESFIRILKRGFTSKGKPNIKISYRCLDPSLILKPLAESCYSFIAMSGTLTPIEIYSDLFGIKSRNVELPSPFPVQNKLNIIIPDTTTKFTMRNEMMYKRIADYCARLTNIVPGSSAVFFPSYNLRDTIYNLMQNHSEKTIFLEMQRMSKQDKSELIERFKRYKEQGAVLLGVSAGNFGEGLDFKDNLLKCVVVVGLPLSKPDLETQELIRYYDKKYGKGWEYGYTLPALTKCLQNAGRCIRSETDKGVVIYLDERFTWQRYSQYFPKTENIRITKEPVHLMNEFFKENFSK